MDMAKKTLFLTIHVLPSGQELYIHGAEVQEHPRYQFWRAN